MTVPHYKTNFNLGLFNRTVKNEEGKIEIIINLVILKVKVMLKVTYIQWTLTLRA